jgi:hypothetical protein
MIKKMVRGLILSDTHLGHRHTQTSFIINNIIEMFHNYRNKIKDIDFIALLGDLTDKSLLLSHNDTQEIMEFMHWLAKYCIDKSIPLILLKGTDSHELTHMKFFAKNLELSYPNLDIKYIDSVSLINLFGLNICCVPDNVIDDNNELIEVINHMLADNNLDKFDLMFMHTAFRYQLPYIPKDNSSINHLRDEEYFSQIVNYYCISGHIHKHSKYMNILVPGSIDRLAHNEEEDKGMLLISIHPTLGASYEFLINKNAKRYITLNIHNDIAEDEIKLKTFITKKLKGVPIDSNIRIRTTSAKLNSYLKDKLLSKFNVKIEVEKDTIEVKKEREKRARAMLLITPNNIDKLVRDRIELSPNEQKIYNQDIQKIFKG